MYVRRLILSNALLMSGRKMSVSFLLSMALRISSVAVNNHIQLTMKKKLTAYLMEQLSVMMPCIIKREKWALCQVEPTIHQLLKVSLFRTVS